MGGKIPLGFTIVETLIVLAISGTMIAVAFDFISGQQANTEFNQGIRQIAEDLQQQIGQVQSGYVLDNGDIYCSQTSDQYIDITATSEPGGNLGCQYIGEVFQFGKDIDGTNDNHQYNIYPVASNQYSQLLTKTPAGSVKDIYPCSVYEPSNVHCGLYDQNLDKTDAYTSETLPENITIKSVTVSADSTTWSSQMVAYYNVLASGTYSDCNGGQLGESGFGALPVTIVPFVNIPFDQVGDDSDTAENTIDHNMCINVDDGTYYAQESDYNSPVQICLDSGSTNQSGIITLGDSGSPSSVNLSIEDTSCP